MSATQLFSTLPHTAPTSEDAGIPVEWGYSYQGGQLLGWEATELRKLGQEERPCGCELSPCSSRRGPGNCSGSLCRKRGATTIQLPAVLLWTRAGAGLSRPSGRFYDRQQDTRAGAPIWSPGPPPARLTASLPSYWTLNVQLLGWLFARFGFWSSALPAKSCAPLVTVAL